MSKIVYQKQRRIQEETKLEDGISTKIYRNSNKYKHSPVIIAVRPVPSIPSVTSSAVEEAENPDGPFLLKNQIILFPSLSLYLMYDVQPTTQGDNP